MSDELFWMERAQSAEAKLTTMKESHEKAVEKVREFKTNFGVKERSDGSIDIDFDKFTQALGIEPAFELRAIIDETYQISGDPGEKPHIKLVPNVAHVE